MDKYELIKMASDFVEESRDNFVSKDIAISESVEGLKMYEEPILAFGSADDEYFELFKDPAIIGKHFISPKEWLPGAKTVISFFLPFTKEVKEGNRRNMVWPSEGWLHARIEGQAFLAKLCGYLNSQLIDSGYNSMVPLLDERFWSITSPKGAAGQDKNSDRAGLAFTSNWSERHAAFVCGLGTFGLSKGLITKKGMAGRFGSIITDLYISPDTREYKDVYEYCNKCGACVRNCPVNAISIEEGKNHTICSGFLGKTVEKFRPRYGCGKCQVAVPCESGIPKKSAAK